jgi:hypothetical protein
LNDDFDPKRIGLNLDVNSAVGSEALGEDQMFEIMQQDEEDKGMMKRFTNFESNSRTLTQPLNG